MMVINLYVRHHKTGDGTLVCNEMCKKCDLARRARRKLIRWLNLAAVLTFRLVVEYHFNSYNNKLSIHVIQNKYEKIGVTKCGRLKPTPCLRLLPDEKSIVYYRLNY